MSKTIIIEERQDLSAKWARKENEEIGLRPDIPIPFYAQAFWRCQDKSHLYRRSISKEATRKSECPICRKENKKYLLDYPQILQEFAYDLNTLKPEELTKGDDRKVFWRCLKCHGVYETSPYHKIKEGTGCPYCKKKKVLAGYNDVATLRPDILQYWDFEKNLKEGIRPEEYMPSAKKEAWWLCSEGHSTLVKIQDACRPKQFCCIECKRLKREERKRQGIERKLRKQEREEADKKRKIDKAIKQKREELHSEIMISNEVRMFWDEEENAARGFDINHLNKQRLFCWKCNNGHKWKSDILTMKNTPECRICKAHDNSIAKLYPFLKDIYDTEKNGNVPPEECRAVLGSYYWWKCKQGHSFVAQLSSVIMHKETGCMYCDKEKSYYSI